MKKKLRVILQFLLNPRLLLCLGLAWFITNGWSYMLFAIGSITKSSVLLSVSGAYLAFLWLPVSPEKIVTVAIAIFLLKKLFPEDEKTLGVLKRMKEKFKLKKNELKEKHLAKRESKTENSAENNPN